MLISVITEVPAKGDNTDRLPHEERTFSEFQTFENRTQSSLISFIFPPSNRPWEWSSEFGALQLPRARVFLRISTPVNRSVVTDHQTFARLVAGGTDGEGQLYSTWTCFAQRTWRCCWLHIDEPWASQIISTTSNAFLTVAEIRWGSLRESSAVEANSIYEAHWDYQIKWLY